MPLMETITIVNTKSGKIVSTGQHLVNIFKDAKDAYQEKKAEIRAEHRWRYEQKLLNDGIKQMGLEDGRSTTSSRRSHRSRDSHHRRHKSSRPALTERNLDSISRSVEGDEPSVINEEDAFEPSLPIRRQTQLPDVGGSSHREIAPYRRYSDPDLHDKIDMDLAYGELPGDAPNELDKEAELQGLMTRFDHLMMEAHCVQHTATTIMESLQANPDAMAAIALTLAEISNLVTKMGPNILTVLYNSSPAIFALLASPQFLIAGGVAVGVTIVMFNGYKIIKKLQANAIAEREMEQPVEALPFDGEFELTPIDNWRRGIALEAERSIGTSVDGEFITPEADKISRYRKWQRKAKSSKARSELDLENFGALLTPTDLSGPTAVDAKSVRPDAKSVVSAKTTVGKSVASEKTTRSKSSPKTSKSKSKDKEKEKEKEIEKKRSTLSLLLKGKGDKAKTKEKESRSRSHTPRLVEV